MKVGLFNNDYTHGRRKGIHNSLAVISLALLPTVIILTIVITSLAHDNSPVLDVYLQLNIKSAEASTGGASTAEKNSTASETTSAAPQNADDRQYSNPLFGLNLKYPSTWSAFELNSRFRDNVTYAVALLRAPLENASDKYPERININTQTFNSNNVTLDAFTSAVLNAYKNITGVKILESGPTTLAGQPAHRVVYTDDRVEGLKLMKNQVWSVINNSKAYVITFGSEGSRYDTNLPQVQNILNSLKITSASDNPEEEKEISLDDPISGIKLEYPSTWTKVQIGQPPRSNVDLVAAFFHRENQNASISRIGIASQDLPQAGNLGQYTSNQLAAIKRVNATGIQDDKDTIGGNPAHNAVFNLNNTKVMQKWTVKGDKAYILAYQATPDEYSKNLPTF